MAAFDRSARLRRQKLAQRGKLVSPSQANKALILGAHIQETATEMPVEFTRKERLCETASQSSSRAVRG